MFVHNSPTKKLNDIKTLKSELSILNILSVLFQIPEARETAQKASSDLARITKVIDGFYQLLGKNNWICFSSMNLDRLESISSHQSPEAAERELIAYLKEEGVLERMITQLNRFPDMRPRLNLLRKAEQDYLDGRYYSSVLVTISVMDGFVNDIDKHDRHGLHTRKPEDVLTNDRVSTVWEGLPSAVSVFNKSIHKRIDEPIYDVYRHGIMHGMLTNFDNDIVASKAWCMLFAVADWADSKAMLSSKQGESPIFLDALKKLASIKKGNEETDRMLDMWVAHEVDLENPANKHDKLVIETCNSFFEAWKKGNYGKLAEFFPENPANTLRKQAGIARKYYSSYPIVSFEILNIDRCAAAIAQIKVKLTSNDNEWIASMRLVRQNENIAVAEWEPGSWKVIEYAVAPFKPVEE